jgi:hypothetical protein
VSRPVQIGGSSNTSGVINLRELAELQAELEELKKLVLLLAGAENLSISFGIAEIKWKESPTAEVIVKHSLGKVPKYIFITQEQQITENTWPEYETPLSEATALQFRIFASNVNHTVVKSAATLMYYMVVG